MQTSRVFMAAIVAALTLTLSPQASATETSRAGAPA